MGSRLFTFGCEVAHEGIPGCFHHGVVDMAGIWAFKKIIAPTGGGSESVVPEIGSHENASFCFPKTTGVVRRDVLVCSLLTHGSDQSFCLI